MVHNFGQQPSHFLESLLNMSQATKTISLEVVPWTISIWEAATMHSINI
jgi:hypothetical protein